MESELITKIRSLMNIDSNEELIDILIEFVNKSIQSEKSRKQLQDSFSALDEEGTSAFMTICKNPKLEKMNIKLIDWNCINLLQQNNDGFNCLTYAILGKCEDLIIKIIDKEPIILESICKKGVTPIVYAMRQKLWNIVIYMLQKNNNLMNCVDVYDSTPFLYLIDTTYNLTSNIASCLEVNVRNSGMEIHVNRINSEDNDGFHKILNYIFENNIEIRVGQPNSHGDTALIFAVYVFNEDLAIQLFEKYGTQCSINNMNKAGETAISFAIKYYMNKFVNILLYSNLDDIGLNNVSQSLNTPLLLAIENGNENVVLKI
jgi:hypothetical protein